MIAIFLHVQVLHLTGRRCLAEQMSPRTVVVVVVTGLATVP